MDFISIAAVLAAFFIVTVSPGPATIALASVSMRSGRANGMRFALGLALGLAFWGMIAATGLGAVLQGSIYVLTALKLLGGLYLLWLAYTSGRAAFQKDKAQASYTATGKWFARGLLLNLSNPKAVVAWMAALSMGMTDGQGVAQVITATVLCAALGGVVYAGYALAFSLTGVMDSYRRASRWIDGVVAGLFAIAGLGLIRSGLSALKL